MNAALAIAVLLDCIIGVGFLSIWRRKRRERKEMMELARRNAEATEMMADAVKRAGEHTQTMAVAIGGMSETFKKVGVSMSAVSSVLSSIPTSMSSGSLGAGFTGTQFCGRTDLAPHSPHSWARRPDGSYGDYDDQSREMIWCPGL